MKYVVIDDEVHARQNLKRKLTRISSELEYVGEAANVEEATVLLANQEIDLLFLDIEMPGATGFDLLDQFASPSFNIVFVTAYNEFALKAFEYFTIGYVTKPIDISLLENVVNKALQLRTAEQARIDETLQSLTSKKITKVVIPSSDGSIFLSSEEVILIESEDGYTWVHTADGQRKLSTKRLKEYDQVLTDDTFLRVHRSVLVNVDHVSSYSKQGVLVTSNGFSITLNKNRRKAIGERIRHMVKSKRGK